MRLHTLCGDVIGVKLLDWSSQSRWTCTHKYRGKGWAHIHLWTRLWKAQNHSSKGWDVILAGQLSNMEGCLMNVWFTKQKRYREGLNHDEKPAWIWNIAQLPFCTFCYSVWSAMDKHKFSDSILPSPVAPGTSEPLSSGLRLVCKGRDQVWGGSLGSGGLYERVAYKSLFCFSHILWCLQAAHF